MNVDMKECLEKHVCLLRDFLQVATDEYALLLDNFEPQQLAQSTHRKNDFLTAMQQLEQQRNYLLGQMRLSPDATGLKEFTRRHPEHAVAVDQIIQLSAKADQQNSNNGVLIEAFLTSNQQALDTLSALAGKNSFYDAHGRTRLSANASTSLKA